MKKYGVKARIETIKRNYKIYVFTRIFTQFYTQFETIKRNYKPTKL